MLLCLFQSVQAQVSLPDNLFADTLHAPFLWGVASGDPLPDGVVLWTRPNPGATQGSEHVLTWEVATDEVMADIVASGSVEVSVATDHCARVEVSGLQPSSTYFYRFTSADNQYSAVGRTRTAPQGDAEQLRFAVASCSSIYSGYFNAYRRISERDDLDLVIHLGDYIYDFVDEEEQIRIPDPFPTVPQNEEEWRERHRYYLLDPDLRATRQRHPWTVIWDNHDYESDPESGFNAFYEYVPRRDVHGDIGKAHRTLRYGNLADLTIIDIQKFRNIDTLAPDEVSVLSNDQRAWFLNELGGSTAQWRIIGNQKMFGGWISEGVPTWLPVPNDGDVFDRGSWDGFQAERDSVLSFIEENEIDNVMVISGDVHMSFGMDISRDPTEGSVYDPVTGEGALGVEFVPTSISRGNLDEAGVPTSVVPIFEGLSNGINPHHQFVDFVQHGYGILSIDHDSIVAEWWYSPILQLTENESLGKRMTMVNGENHWKRPDDGIPIGIMEGAPKNGLNIFPNPSHGLLRIQMPNDEQGLFTLRIRDLRGLLCLEQMGVSGAYHTVGTEELMSGTYLLELEGMEGIQHATFVKL